MSAPRYNCTCPRCGLVLDTISADASKDAGRVNFQLAIDPLPMFVHAEPGSCAGSSRYTLIKIVDVSPGPRPN